MSIVATIILGLISGFIASRIVNHQGAGVVLDIVLGIVGAMVGSFVFHLIGQAGVTGLNLWSLLVSVAGAAVVLIVYHAIQRGRVTA